MLRDWRAPAQAHAEGIVGQQIVDDRGEAYVDSKKFVYRNAVTYELPGSLSDLTGPSTGVINLPRTIYWGPAETVDLSDRVDVQRMYQALVRMGTVVQQVEWLNRHILIEAWPDLVLPTRCISHWEDSFPELQLARHTLNDQRADIREVVRALYSALGPGLLAVITNGDVKAVTEWMVDPTAVPAEAADLL